LFPILLAPTAIISQRSSLDVGVPRPSRASANSYRFSVGCCGGEASASDPELLVVYRERPMLYVKFVCPGALGPPMEVRGGETFWWRGVQHYLSSTPSSASRARNEEMKAYLQLLPSPGARFVYTHPGVCWRTRGASLQYNVYVTAALTDVITLKEILGPCLMVMLGLAEVVRRLVATYRAVCMTAVCGTEIWYFQCVAEGAPGNRQGPSWTSTGRVVCHIYPMVLARHRTGPHGWWTAAHCVAFYSVGPFFGHGYCGSVPVWTLAYGRWHAQGMLSSECPVASLELRLTRQDLNVRS